MEERVAAARGGPHAHRASTSGSAEELAHDALAAALEEWPASVRAPAAHRVALMTAAKNRARNAVRDARTREPETHEALGHELVTHVPLADLEAA